MHYSKTIRVLNRKGDAAMMELLQQLILVQEESARAITALEEKIKKMEGKA